MCIRDRSTWEQNHLHEIFGNFGKIKNVEYPLDEKYVLPKNYAQIEYETQQEAQEAIFCMNGAQIDGEIIKCELLQPEPKKGKEVEKEKDKEKEKEKAKEKKKRSDSKSKSRSSKRRSNVKKERKKEKPLRIQKQEQRQESQQKSKKTWKIQGKKSFAQKTCR
eukprot:TRINITY_DN6176_c0_g1_i14.p2 TRINITY_DN6176_c0_g1~~TRINITY_DN6176_c0_g1_i14.p2  ORF type:complete len:163 (-),score=31.92 TRINITY_DN6176_c0_g1_i14:46-534(-)